MGILLIGLGVNILSRANLGLGAWDTVTFNLNLFFNEAITKGMTSWIISSVIMTIVILYSRKLVLFFMYIPIILVGFSIDFWDIIVFGVDFMPSMILVRFLLFVLGVVILPLGLSLVVASKFPAFVFDELTIVVMDFFHTSSITKARLGIEFAGIVIGSLFGFLAGIGFGYVNIGSIVLSFLLPPMIDFYVTKLGRFDEVEDKK